ncbi:MAG: TIGR04086 family membrane protein [Lachnospiraceae bacterium]|nr:TIGR04086 family membrane protein [Lachnospiraceae bacterium]
MLGRIKKIAVGLCTSVICSLILAVADAVLMLEFNLKESALVIVIGITYFLSCFLGGFVSGRMSDSKKYIGGLCCGVMYFTVLVLISALIPGRSEMDVMRAVGCMVICILGGCVGGMAST